MVKRLKVDAHVFQHAVNPPRYGNIVWSVARLQWMFRIRFDNKAEYVQVSSRAIKLVDSTVALSPGAKSIVAPENADGEDLSSSESESDKSDKSSSESEF